MRRCNIRNNRVTLDDAGLWLPWEDYEVAVGEWRKERTELLAEIRNLESQTHDLTSDVARMADKLEETQKKLASARSQISKLKRKTPTGAT